MEGILVFGVIIAVVAAFDVLALRFGTDSRVDERDRRAARTGITV